MRTLLIITSSCYPVFKASAGMRPYSLARALRALGWRTMIVTQWGDQSDIPPCEPNGIAESLAEQSSEDVVVLPVLPEPTLGRRIVGMSRSLHKAARAAGPVGPVLHLIGSLLSVTALLSAGDTHVTGGGWTAGALRAAKALARAQNVDAVLSMYEWDCSWVARKYSRAAGVPWVHYFLDAWQMFVPRVGRPVHGAYLKRHLLPSAAAVCHATPGWARHLSEELHRPVTTIMIGFDPDAMRVAAPVQFGKFTVVYAGPAAIGSQDPDIFFAGLARLRQEDPSAGNQVQVVYAGLDREVFIRRAEEFGLGGSLRCVGMLPPQSLLRHLKGAVLLLISLDSLDQRNDYAHGRLCGRLAEYFGSERPILATIKSKGCKDTDLARIIRNTGAGWVARDSEEVARILKTLMGEYGRTGHIERPGSQHGLSDYLTMRNQVAKLAAVLDRVTKGERDPVIEDFDREFYWLSP